jgi:dihydrofolate reductase
MRKVIAAINMSVDGFCEHTAIIGDDEIHQHYTELLRSAGTALYGRITYQLMEYWLTVVKEPTGIKPTDEFAQAIDTISKIVFSKTLKKVEWHTATVAKGGIKEEVLELKQSHNGGGKDIIVGSRSLIMALLNLNLVDELQLCVHPVIVGNGTTPLFKNINDRSNLKLLKTKTFGCGAVVFYYEISKK